MSGTVFPIPDQPGQRPASDGRPAGAPAAGYPPDLLATYHALARSSPRSLPATALRTRSSEARHLLAYAVAGSAMSLDELLSAARNPANGIRSLKRHRADRNALAELARVISLQDILPDDREDGLAMYRLATDLPGKRLARYHRCLHAQLEFVAGEWDRAAALCRWVPRMANGPRGDLLVDLKNPFVRGRGEDDVRRWFTAFGKRFFPQPGPILASIDGASPFDRLSSPRVATAATTMITVIVTSYRPDTGIITAVRSILEQSWDDLEVLVLDDGSPPEFDELLDRCQAMDPRVRVVKLPVNAGTYAARNAGLDAATAEFVTFQDSDDWSHPRRLEKQIEPLLADSSLVATTSRRLLVNDDLTITRPGRSSRGTNPWSVMLRKTPVLERVGYFHHIRKAADNEYLGRIEAAFGDARIYAVQGDGYALVRQTAESLSRAEFRAGWTHPARTMYWGAYRRWHQSIRENESSPYLPASPDQESPLPAIPHLTGTKTEVVSRRVYDVIFVTDWRPPLNESQRATMLDIFALARRGLRLAITHLESYEAMTSRRRLLSPPVQQLVNSGVVDQITDVDEVDATLLVVRQPATLQFPRLGATGVRATQTLIIADQAPCGPGDERWYHPPHCTTTAERLFSASPTWSPADPGVRARLERELPEAMIASFDLPGVVDPDEWGPVRTELRTEKPVLGCHSYGRSGNWLPDRRSTLRLYPDSANFDVRFLGGRTALHRMFGQRHLPRHWTILDDRDLDVSTYLRELDFFIYFPHPDRVELSSPVVLEALAAGCVTILPERLAAVFGDAAIYCEPDQVEATVRRYHTTPQLYLAQSEVARKLARERYRDNAYLQFLDQPLAKPTAGVPCQNSKDGEQETVKRAVDPPR